MEGYDERSYGQAFADVYDDWYGTVTDIDATATAVARLARVHPELPVLELGVGTGRLALATAYSARASDYAGVSTPLAWKEVTRRLDPRDFTIKTAPSRFAEVGDLWKPMRTLKPVNIPRVLSRLKSLL